ncbi:Rv0361 family membrane protein [Plantactinospora soyae]|uniref:DUF4878 domain-containing protein n=1 Tax=Plantactinospora soyae TaxID=1544732 RepID=A0A927QWD7_9ACTN|nr:hypothetical protein [Plantactinospora soyae]MBE1486780.1 hypothetical protein [Plantactinospora soyae]
MTHPPLPPRRPPRRKSGEPLPVLLDILVTLLAVGCVVGAAGGYWLHRSFEEALGSVERTADEYVSSLRAGNWADAYRQTCAATQRSMTEQEFVAAQQSGPKATGYEVVRTSVDDHNGRRATLILRVTYVGGEVRTQEIPLVDEGSWYPCP